MKLRNTPTKSKHNNHTTDFNNNLNNTMGENEFLRYPKTEDDRMKYQRAIPMSMKECVMKFEDTLRRY